MSEIMPQLNFTFGVSKEEYEQAVFPLLDLKIKGGKE